jgi:hypothetical protein
VNVKVQDPEATRLLFNALRTRTTGGALVKVTKADAVALTGMPSAKAEPALKSLVRDYRSHLAVTDEGELVYEFEPSFERRDKVPLAERLRTAGQLAWRGFSFLFKIWIVVTLVAYVVAFIAMMIGLTVAGRSNDRDDRRGGGFGIPWIWYLMMPDLAPSRDPWGRPVRRLEGAPKKRFYQSVFDFVFGPKRPAADPKELEKQLVSFLRAHKGRVTASELAALTGLGLDAADEELTRLLVEYDGEVEVAEDGTLLYVFDELMRTTGQLAGARWSWDFEKKEPAEALTGNTPGTNAVVGGFAGFNLIASLTVGPAFLQRMHLAGEPWALFLVSVFPLIFSFIFFLVPSARWLASRRRAQKRERRALRRALWREIWAQPGAARDPSELALLAATRAGASPEAARAMLERMLPELDGDIDTDDNGKIRYRFPRLEGERAAVEAARTKAAPPVLGEVVFSSEDAPN